MQYIGDMSLEELINYEDELSSEILESMSAREEVRQRIEALENQEDGYYAEIA